jgi:hypothetical protein
MLSNLPTHGWLAVLPSAAAIALVVLSVLTAAFVGLPLWANSLVFLALLWSEFCR